MKLSVEEPQDCSVGAVAASDDGSKSSKSRSLCSAL